MVNINGEEWHIKIASENHPRLCRSDGKYALGSCDNSSKTIYINENLTQKKMKQVLCHELVHAAVFSYDIELSLQQEELLADLVATYGQEIITITNKIFNRLREKGNLV